MSRLMVVVLKVLFWAITIALFFALLWQVVKVFLLLKRGEEVRATIIKYDKKFDTDGYESDFPVLEYKFGGHTKRFTDNYSGNPNTDPIGKEIPILIDPKNEHSVKIKSFWGIYQDIFLYLILFLSCLVILLL